MSFFIELLRERRKVAGTFHVPSACPGDGIESKAGYGTWNVPATLPVEAEAA